MESVGLSVYLRDQVHQLTAMLLDINFFFLWIVVDGVEVLVIIRALLA